LGILSAEKSITVCPTWKVEGVWLTFNRLD
jgi:hypothetical protein